MKYLATLFLARSALAFHVPLSQHQQSNVASINSNILHRRPLHMTMDDGDAPSDMDDSAYDSRQDLMDVAKSLKEEFGPLIIDSKAQEKLKSVVKELEKNSEPPMDTEGMIGDWTLLCSTASTEKFMGVDTSNLPFFNADFAKDIRATLNKSLMVQQKIKTASDDSTEISRIDHVIQYMPPNELSAFSSALPDALKSLNINPLEVTNQQVILVHKAELESTIPFLKTKLALESVILKVAGKSQYLEPDGADLLGVNVPFGEFLNAGSFETTYLDDTLRISRSKVGVVDQLRVFVRAPTVEEVVEAIEDAVEEAAVEAAVEAAIEAPSDVEDEEESEEVVDVEVINDSDDDDDVDADAPSDVEGSD